MAPAPSQDSGAPLGQVTRANPRSTLRRMLAAGLIAYGAALAAGWAYLLPAGAPVAQLNPLMGWSLIPSGMIAAWAGTLERPMTALGPLARTVLVGLLGLATGLAAFLLVVKLRGGWVAPVPVFACWGYGGFAGLLCTTAAPSLGERGLRAAGLMIATGLLLLIQSRLRLLG